MAAPRVWHWTLPCEHWRAPGSFGGHPCEPRRAHRCSGGAPWETWRAPGRSGRPAPTTRDGPLGVALEPSRRATSGPEALWWTPHVSPGGPLGTAVCPFVTPCGPPMWWWNPPVSPSGTPGAWVDPHLRAPVGPLSRWWTPPLEPRWASGCCIGPTLPAPAVSQSLRWTPPCKPWRHPGTAVYYPAEPKGALMDPPASPGRPLVAAVDPHCEPRWSPRRCVPADNWLLWWNPL